MTAFELDKYKRPYEPEKHWQLRKTFMLAHIDRFPEDRLVCLANCFLNMELMGCKYPEATMELVKELSEGMMKEYEESKKQDLKRTFVSASEAAEMKFKRPRDMEKLLEMEDEQILSETVKSLGQLTVDELKKCTETGPDHFEQIRFGQEVDLSAEVDEETLRQEEERHSQIKRGRAELLENGAKIVQRAPNNTEQIHFSHMEMKQEPQHKPAPTMCVKPGQSPQLWSASPPPSVWTKPGQSAPQTKSLGEILAEAQIERTKKIEEERRKRDRFIKNSPATDRQYNAAVAVGTKLNPSTKVDKSNSVSNAGSLKHSNFSTKVDKSKPVIDANVGSSKLSNSSANKSKSASAVLDVGSENKSKIAGNTPLKILPISHLSATATVTDKPAEKETFPHSESLLQVNSWEDLLKWSLNVLSNFRSTVDVEQLINSLEPITTLEDVEKLVQQYLGETKRSIKFSRQFFQRKVSLLSSEQKVEVQAVTPTSKEVALVNQVTSKKGKKKRKKKTTVD